MRRRQAAFVALASFVALGLPEAVVATAWPDIAEDMARPIGDLQWLLVSYTVGYLLSSGPAGALVSRIGVRHTAVLGVSVAIGGLALFALGPAWPWLVAASFLVGAGAGPLDTAMNVWATTRGPRVMNLLHAAFGVGTTLGPPLTIAAVAITSWRGAYVVLVLFDLCLLGAVWLVGPDHRPAAAHRQPAARPSFGWPTVGILTTFAVYVGVEITAGAWGYSYLRDQHGLSPTAAGFGIAGYWAALTAGRVGLGVAGSGLRPRSVLVVGATGAVAACVLFSSGVAAGSVAGLILLGFCLSGQFPALMLLTPEMVGEARAPYVVGWSLSASGVSAATAAIVIGQQVDRSGLGIVGPNLVVGSALLLGLVVLVTRQRTSTQASRSVGPGSANSVVSSPNSSTARSSDR